MSARNRALWGRALLLSAIVTMTAHPAVHAQGNVGLPSAPPALAETQAQKFLKSLPREWSGTSRRDCKTYEDKNIARLAPPFAASAARFLHAFVEVHGHVTITSAHRTAQEQTCVCEGERGPCAGRPRVATKKRRRIVKRGTSRHQAGIALDVRAGIGTDEEFACLHEFAQFNPQFGVRFPLGKRDRPHMEPAQSNHTPLRLAAIGSVTRQVTPCAKLKIMLIDAPAD
jgi:D-alanyl-D-alanine carboxypeptidase